MKDRVRLAHQRLRTRSLQILFILSYRILRELPGDGAGLSLANDADKSRCNKNIGGWPNSAAPYGINGGGKLSRMTRQGFDQLALKLFLGAFAGVFALALKDFAWRR